MNCIREPPATHSGNNNSFMHTARTVESTCSFPALTRNSSLISSRRRITLGGMAVKVAVMVVMVVTALAVTVPKVEACGDVTTLASCLPASTTGSMPTPECCTALATYAQGGTAQGEACLCNAVSNPTASSHGAKAAYAILIPQKCKLNYKAGYVCNGVVVPGGH